VFFIALEAEVLPIAAVVLFFLLRMSGTMSRPFLTPNKAAAEGAGGLHLFCWELVCPSRYDHADSWGACKELEPSLALLLVELVVFVFFARLLGRFLQSNMAASIRVVSVGGAAAGRPLLANKEFFLPVFFELIVVL
jgi:hypothetical protein